MLSRPYSLRFQRRGDRQPAARTGVSLILVLLASAIPWQGSAAQPSPGTLALHDSWVIGVTASVTSYRDDAAATRWVEQAWTQDTLASQLLGEDFIHRMPSATVRFENVSVPAMGTARAAWKMSVSTAAFSGEGYGMLFCVGSKVARVVVLGARGEVALEDALAFSKLVEARTRT